MADTKERLPDWSTPHFDPVRMRQLTQVITRRLNGLADALDLLTEVAAGPFAPLVHEHEWTDINNAPPFITLADLPPNTGEANTSSNVGTGAGLAKPKAGVNLPFKSINGGAGIDLVVNTDDIVIGIDFPAFAGLVASGLQGPPGMDGFDGEDGMMGPPGPAGRDGSSSSGGDSWMAWAGL